MKGLRQAGESCSLAHTPISHGEQVKNYAYIYIYNIQIFSCSLMSFNQLYYILNIINAPAAGSVEQLGIVGTKHFVPQQDQDSN